LELLEEAPPIKEMRIQQFQKAVYQNILKHADAVLGFVDALTAAGHVDSP